MPNVTPETVATELQNVCDDLQRVKYLLSKGMLYSAANILGTARAHLTDTDTRLHVFCQAKATIEKAMSVPVTIIQDCTCGRSIPPHSTDCPRFRNLAKE